MNPFVLVAYASLAASGTLLQWLLACLNFILGRFILLVQTRKAILMNIMAVAGAAENHRDE